MAFFKQFPVISYNTLSDGIINDVIDIFRHVDVNEVLIDNASTYTFYEIKNGERPDTVSSRLYGTPDYYWTFFVTNDSLKSGLNSWPMEYNQHKSWIDQEYGDYSVLIFAPIQKRVIIDGEDTLEHIDYMGGLDFTNVEIIDEDNNSAEILKYDINSLQLWVHDVSSTSFLAKDKFRLRYKENPYQGEEYEEFEKQRLDWLKSIYLWTQKNYPTSYYSFTLRDLEEDGIVFDTPEYYELFYTEYFQSIIFESRKVFAKAYNAPKFYLDADIEENSIISGFQAYNLEYDLSELEIEPYMRGQLEEYEEVYSSFTKGLVTDVTNDTYTNTYTSGSYFIYRPNPISTSISYLEYEEEKNFERRKIRIIRKEVIDDFVDRYKELIKS
jgi:hypothetical protein